MKKITITPKQRMRLQMQLENTKNTETSRRIFALLTMSQGSSVSTIVQSLNVGRQTVYDWMNRFLKHKSPQSLVRHPGQGRPRLLNKSMRMLLRSTLKKSPQKLGYAATQWTIPMLADYLFQKTGMAISRDTIHRQLQQWGYVWKRFRYVLPPDPELEKKKANFANDSGTSCTLCGFGVG